MRHETSVVVNRPIDEVWAFMTDPFTMPRWNVTTLRIRQTSPGPQGLGSTFELRLVIFGFETRISGSVTEWEPPHTLALSFTGAGIRSGSLRGTFESKPDGTRIARVSELEPRPAFKLLWWIGWPFLRRKSDASDQHIKRLLEADRG